MSLFRLFKGRAQPWQVGATGFEARMPLQEPEGVVIYKVHLIGWEERRLRFHASVTLWPRRQRPKDVWYPEVVRALRRYGYRGEWRRGKFHHGDFWKRFESVRALKAEIGRLEQWCEQPPWRRRPTTVSGLLRSSRK